MAAAVAEMYAGGLSTRKVEAVAKGLGVDSLGKDRSAAYAARSTRPRRTSTAAGSAGSATSPTCGSTRPS